MGSIIAIHTFIAGYKIFPILTINSIFDFQKYHIGFINFHLPYEKLEYSTSIMKVVVVFQS